MSADLLKALVDPASVALVGISGDETKLSARPMRFMIANGFAGRIYPVNPGRDTIMGQTAYPNVSAIPGSVDHAYLLVPTDAVEEALRDCAASGVKVVSVLADGFAEAGEIGLERQARITAIAKEAGIFLIGPNSMGVVNTHNGFVCTTNAAFGASTISKGGTAVLSQSGSIIGTLLSRGAQRGAAFSRLISLGNEAVSGAGALGLALLDDPAITSFALFLETIRDPDELAEFGRRAAQAGKPVVAYTLGRSDEGKALAVSHTGALVGSQVAVTSFLAANGIRRVDLLDSFLDAPDALARIQLNSERPKQVTVVSTTGGGGAMVIDQLSLRGVEIAGCSEDARKVLSAQKIPLGSGKLVDVTLAGARYDTMKAVVSTLMKDPETGLLVVATGSSAQFNPELAVKPVIDAIAEAPAGSAPVVAIPLPHAPDSLRMLREGGVTAFASIEAGAEILSMVMNPVQVAQGPKDKALPVEVTDLIDAAIAAGQQTLDETASGAILRALGVPFPQQVHLAPDEGIEKADGLRYPLVAKVVSPDLPHKSDAGAVALNINDREALAEAVRNIRASAQRYHPGYRDEGVLVQEMRRGVGEALVGVTRDPLVGAILTVGMGGVLAEVYGDVAVHPAPVGLETARDMIAGIRGFAPLRGYRGAKPGDLEDLARLASTLSCLMQDPRVAEAEINPVIIGPEGEGVVAVDALIHLNPAS